MLRLFRITGEGKRGTHRREYAPERYAQAFHLELMVPVAYGVRVRVCLRLRLWWRWCRVFSGLVKVRRTPSEVMSEALLAQTR